MKNLYAIIKTIASEIDEAIVFFSTGKDSIVTLDLCCKYLKKVIAIHHYYVKDLSYREKFFKYYEKRYNIIIDQVIQPDASKILNNNVYNINKKKLPVIKFTDIEFYVRQKYNISYIAYGYRKDESLQRRGQLTKCKGIERKHKRIFLVADWSSNDIFNYIKKNKLPLPPEYKDGFRDINFYQGDSLIWLYQTYPEDYEKFKSAYPMIEGELLRALNR